MESQEQGNVAKLGELIKDVEMAMLTTVTADGALRSRPMATQKRPFDGTLWFLTEGTSGKIDEISKDHQVNLAYTDPKSQKYVSVSGRAEEVHDREVVKDLWNPMYKAWFPNGPEDPNVVALRVDVDSAEYWDAPNSKIVYAIGLAKALATGKRYEGEGTEHGNIRLS